MSASNQYFVVLKGHEGFYTKQEIRELIKTHEPFEVNGELTVYGHIFNKIESAIVMFREKMSFARISCNKLNQTVITVSTSNGSFVFKTDYSIHRK